MSDREELSERLSRLADEELLQMVVTDFAQYPQEAVDLARSELDRRGLGPDPKSSCRAEDGDEDGDKYGDEYLVPKVIYKVFRGTFATWNSLFDEAAAFASQLGSDRLISISHSEDKDDGVVAVWYWSRTETK